MRIGTRTLKLQTTITLMICGVVAILLLVVYTMFGWKVATETKDSLENNAIAIARTVSRTPLVIEGLRESSSPPELQSFAENIRSANDVQFVVVMDMHGIRYSHPIPNKVGSHFVGGDESAVLHGRESLSVANGSLGRSVRAFSPVFDVDGHQLGAVAVGISLDRVRTVVRQNETIIYLGILIGSLMGMGGALLLARTIKRMMFGMEPGAIAKLLEERNAMLHSVREGILAVDRESRITLVNTEARRLLNVMGIQEDPLDKNVEQFWPSLRMDKVLETGKPSRDIEIGQNGVTLLANVFALHVNEQIEGAIATFRDKTEINTLMDRLSGVSLYADALRAQTHEFMNKLHVILGLTHMGQYNRLEEYITGSIDNIQSEAGVVIRQVKDPVMAGFLMGKLSRAREAGVRFVLLEDGILPEAANPELSRELITVVGNLLDNAMEAPEGKGSKCIHLGFQYSNETLILTVSDNGRGVSQAEAENMFEKGYSTKGKDRGIGLYLVERSLHKIGGTAVCETGIGEGTRFTVRLPYPEKGESL